MEFHEIANLFPMIGEADAEVLRDDIKANGLLEPIWTYEGKILDGRNRFRACQSLGLEPDYRPFTGDDPVGFVVSLNIHRRHLDKSQLAVIALDIERIEAERARERQAHGKTAPGKTLVEKVPQASDGKARDKAAEKVGVNAHYVSDAKRIQREAPELIDKIRSGELNISKAKKQVTQKLRHERVTDPGYMPEGKYRVLYADPPWKYGDTREGLVGYTGAKDHYPTMSIKELCNLPVKEMAGDDAVLFLWVTSPLLYEAAPVIESWGFKYKASIIWDKVAHNVGHYVSVRHEFLLICTRGSCTPDVKKLHDSVVSIERGKHSEKPEHFRQIIDEIYPHGQRLELFRRGDAPKGWKVWGNEAIAA